jgi:hypothetical protein
MPATACAALGHCLAADAAAKRDARASDLALEWTDQQFLAIAFFAIAPASVNVRYPTDETVLMGRY